MAKHTKNGSFFAILRYFFSEYTEYTFKKVLSCVNQTVKNVEL